MIKVSHLTFQYPKSPRPALTDVSFEIPPGSLTLVTGASGSGKSTLLRSLNGLVPHFSGGQIQGELEVCGKDPIAVGAETMATPVGFVFQEPEAQFVLDVVEDEIAFALENAGMPRAEMKRRVNAICQRLGIEGIRTKTVTAISGGEKQRVALASALVSRPRILLLDEPTSQLDPFSADEVLRYIVALKQSLGLTVIIAEHRLERLLPYADWMIHLKTNGECHFGAPRQVLPEMTLVPPLIAIARRLNLTPLPLTEAAFRDFAPKPAPQASPPVSPSMPRSKVSLETKHLSAQIGEQTILHGVDLALHRGEILTLLGPNGAGKTTLLRALLGLAPSTGERQLDGVSLDQSSLNEIITRVAYLPQNPGDLLFAESVLDELKMTLQNHQMSLPDEALTHFLEKFGLTAKKDVYPRDLSIGELQRTALAAITIHDPPVLLLDEPTRGLDYQNKTELSLLLKNWRDQGKAILVVTHDIEFAAGLADVVTILERGRIIFTGSPQEGFSHFPRYRSQTARLFPNSGWIVPEDVPLFSTG